MSFWNIFWRILSAALYFANIALVIYVSIKLLLKKSDTSKTLSWILCMILLPYIGLILYFLLGQNYRKKLIFTKKHHADLSLKKRIATYQIDFFSSEEQSFNKYLLPFKKLILQNMNNDYSILSVNSEVNFMFSGREALDSMLKDINGAKKHIHLQSFIFKDDATGCIFKDALIAKAKSGVEVRVICDGAGCLGVKKRFFKEMREAGIEVLVFSPIHILMPTSKINYRNHRKILVVDGKIGYVGGVNIADRYYDGGPYKEWRDTQIRVVGESVFSMQASFLLDRYFIINRKLVRRKKYYPDFEITKPTDKIAQNAIYSQILSSGPDSDWATIMQCYFTLITGAKRHIYINTPYFAPTETLLNAIKIAALGGIDVNLMLPERADSSLIHYCSMSYITDLLKAGVNVYLFKNGFNHSKSISVDSELCIVGSANMDSRSMVQDFEISSLLYNSDCSKRLEEQFEKDITRCSKVSLTRWRKRHWFQKVKEAVSRLVSPLL